MRWNTTALAYATIGVIWLVVGMTIGGEQSESFKALLASIAGHHWVGKSIVATVTFLILYMLMKRTGESRNPLMLMLLVCASVIGGGLAIFLFFVSHYLGG